MFEKSPKIENEEIKQQRIVKLGGQAVERELSIKKPEKRKALVLVTFLAMMGAGASEAKAGWESLILGPRGVSGTITGEVGRVLDQKARDKRQEVDQEFSKRRDEISQNIQALEANYQQELAEYQHTGDKQKIAELEQNYKKEMQVLMKLKMDNEKWYNSQLMKLKVRQEIKTQIMIGVRGW